MTVEDNRNYNYTLEKLRCALYTMTVGQGDVRARLWYAYYDLKALDVDDFPVELQTDWKSIKDSLTIKGPKIVNGKPVVGSVENTLKKMRNSTGEKIAIRIVELYRNVLEKVQT